MYLFTRETFEEVYNRHTNLDDIAAELYCSRLTVRNYCNRFGLPTAMHRLPPLVRPEDDINAFRHLRGQSSIAWLHKNSDWFKESYSQYRTRLIRATNWLFAPIPERQAAENWPSVLCVKPPPNRLILIKVINEIWDDPSLINKEPKFLSEKTALHHDRFVPYLNLCYSKPTTPLTVREVVKYLQEETLHLRNENLYA